ncbi:hypothetical protein AAI421_14570 [Rhodococcus aetherivorans]|uniref:hypothetical protein n=1 Tax=Rhodococcus aetherivorans TaxID=191292 RepID=UPI0031E294C4
MRVTDANAAIRIGRWALDNREILPDQVRLDIADLAQRGSQKLMAGLRDDELATLRGAPR